MRKVLFAVFAVLVYGACALSNPALEGPVIDAGGGDRGDMDPVAVDSGVVSDLVAVAGDGAVFLPATCLEAARGQPPVEGDYVLYVDHDGKRPWMAFCRAANGQFIEYLQLQMVAMGQNFSQYTAGGYSPGTDVRTTYQRVRIDPRTLLVDVSDQTYTVSTGMLLHSGKTPVMSVSFGAAMDCIGVAPAGRGNVDFRKTPFSVAWKAFFVGGSGANGSAAYSAGDQVVDLVGGGACGWESASPDAPINQAPGYLPLVY